MGKTVILFGAAVCLCLVNFLSVTEAAWPLERFLSFETMILKTRQNLDTVLAYVSQERMKMYPGSPGGQYPPAEQMNIAQTIFFDDVERRMSSIENVTREMTRVMAICPEQNAAPMHPQNVLVEAFTKGNTSTITVSWDPIPEYDGSNSNIQYKVYFQPIDPDGRITQRLVMFRICDAAQTSASITDLSPLARYRIKVGVVDGKMESTSNAETIQTPDIIPSVPRNLDAKAGYNVLKLNWMEPAHYGRITAYYIYYNDTFTGFGGVQKVVPPATDYVLRNLTEGTEIYVSISAESDNGESERTPPKVFLTETYKPNPVAFFKLEPINASAILLDMSENTGQLMRSPQRDLIQGHEVYITDFDTYENRVYIDNPMANTTVIGGLEPNTGYYVNIKTYTRRSESDTTPFEFVRTEKTAPGRVRNVKCMTQRNNPPMIQLSWTPPDFRSSSKPNEYIINWGVENGIFREETVSNGTLKWVSDLLDSALTHHFNIKGKNDIGVGPAVKVSLTTPPRNFTTPEGIQVNRKKARGGGRTELHVQWQAPPRGYNAGKYRVLYRKFKWVYTGRWSMTEIDDPNATNVTIPIDDPQSSYIVVVRRNEEPMQFRGVQQIPCKVDYDPNDSGIGTGTQQPAENVQDQAFQGNEPGPMDNLGTSVQDSVQAPGGRFEPNRGANRRPPFEEPRQKNWNQNRNRFR